MSFIENKLPSDERLQIAALSRCFKSVANSYKFYWFLSILDHLSEHRDLYISLDELSMRMISSVWYPLDYYKLSFGKQDSFKELANTISTLMQVDNSINSADLLTQINNNLPGKEAERLRRKIEVVLKRWVTYRFLSPFFTDYLKGLNDQQINDKITELTNDEEHEIISPYRIEKKGIRIHPAWANYFNRHQYILRGYIKYHLIQFLQKNNPTVVGLSQKLEKPFLRDLKVAKLYWGKYTSNNATNCIFSNNPILETSYSLDHFIPWSYVAHDQLWNIAPISRAVNSSKSDNLPTLSIYLSPFCDLQYKALKFHIDCGNHKLMEDYHILFKSSNLNSLTKEDFEKVVSLEISNSYRIAENLGFKTNYYF